MFSIKYTGSNQYYLNNNEAGEIEKNKNEKNKENFDPRNFFQNEIKKMPLAIIPSNVFDKMIQFTLSKKNYCHEIFAHILGFAGPSVNTLD